jgi:hypothetical protein
MYKYLLGVVLIFIVLMTWQNWDFYDKDLHGIWRADPDFAKNADIDDMLVYINRKTYKAYVIIYAKGTTVYNKVVDMNFATWPWPWLQSIVHFSVKMHSDKDLSAIIPATYDAKLNIHKGTLKFYDGKKIYAKLKRG